MKAGRCVDPPSAASPQGVPCRKCDGRGCDACHGTGYRWITECPFRVCASVLPVIELARLSEDGSWPESGGVLDQAGGFVEFVTEWRGRKKRAEQDEKAS